MNAKYYRPTDDLTYPAPLTLAQEVELFTAYYDAPVGSLRLDARDTIIQHYLKLVAQLSIRMAKGCLPEDDAVSAGNLGLMNALEAKNFRPGRVQFGSYVRFFVRKQVMLALRSRGTPQARSVLHPYAMKGLLGDFEEADYHQPAEVQIAVDKYATESQFSKGDAEFVNKVLSEFPQRDQEFLRLVSIGGYNHADIGRQMGVSREAVRRWKLRLFPKLQRRLMELKP